MSEESQAREEFVEVQREDWHEELSEGVEQDIDGSEEHDCLVLVEEEGLALSLGESLLDLLDDERSELLFTHFDYELFVRMSDAGLHLSHFWHILVGSGRVLGVCEGQSEGVGEELEDAFVVFNEELFLHSHHNLLDQLVEKSNDHRRDLGRD